MEGYLSVSGGDPTWSVARDDAQEQKEGPRGERCQLSRCKRLRLAARRPQTIPTPEAEKGNRGADMGEKGGKLNKKA